jgi:hypothetical protein
MFLVRLTEILVLTCHNRSSLPISQLFVLLLVVLRRENSYHPGFALLVPLIRGPCHSLILACAPRVRLLLQ